MHPAELSFLNGATASLNCRIPRISPWIAVSSLVSNLDPFSDFESLDAGVVKRMNVWQLPHQAGSGYTGLLTTSEFQEAG